MLGQGQRVCPTPSLARGGGPSLAGGGDTNAPCVSQRGVPVSTRPRDSGRSRRPAPRPPHPVQRWEFQRTLATRAATNRACRSRGGAHTRGARPPRGSRFGPHPRRSWCHHNRRVSGVHARAAHAHHTLPPPAGAGVCACANSRWDRSECMTPTPRPPRLQSPARRAVAVRPSPRRRGAAARHPACSLAVPALEVACAVFFPRSPRAAWDPPRTRPPRHLRRDHVTHPAAKCRCPRRCRARPPTLRPWPPCAAGRRAATRCHRGLRVRRVPPRPPPCRPHGGRP